MAQMPRSSFSTDRLITMGRKLTCLCTRAGNGAQQLAKETDQALSDLENRKLEADKLSFDLDLAREVALQCNSVVDDTVRDVRRACEKHDREHWDDPVINRVFTDHTVSDIVYSGREEELKMVRELISRIKGLEPQNSVGSLAADLEATLDAAVAAEAEFKSCNIAFDEATTQEHMAREQFVRAYQDSYLRARLEVGKKNAHRFFPRLGVRRKTATSTATEKGETVNNEGE